MGVLYALSDRGNFATLRLKVYPGMSGDSTVRREYLRALILSVSGMGNLLPPAQVIAERVVATVGGVLSRCIASRPPDATSRWTCAPHARPTVSPRACSRRAAGASSGRATPA